LLNPAKTATLELDETHPQPPAIACADFAADRDRPRPTYETEVLAQVETAQKTKGTGSLHELLYGSGTWTVE
jgi:hypothetical protein